MYNSQYFFLEIKLQLNIAKLQNIVRLSWCTKITRLISDQTALSLVIKTPYTSVPFLLDF